ncbi:MAG TPA: VOC family protein [Thermoplasmata archaeon]|nr:VOC family protein [Thermoplasmata archaeon]
MTDPKPGAIVHAEFTSNDLNASRKFLEGVFGWKFKKEAMGDAEYWTWDAGSGPAGGLMAPMNGMPPATMNYVLVESIDAALKKIASHGGKVVMPKQEIPTIGWFAVYEVPGGFHQAIFQAAQKR